MSTFLPNRTQWKQHWINHYAIQNITSGFTEWNNLQLTGLEILSSLGFNLSGCAL